MPQQSSYKLMTDEDESPSFESPGYDYSRVSDFLDKKGAVEMIAFIDTSGKRDFEIKETLRVSDPTVDKRKREAAELGLIYSESTRESGQSFESKFYLTTFGVRLREKMKSTGLLEEYLLFQRVRQDFNESREEFVEWASDGERVKRHHKNADEYQPEEDDSEDTE